MRRAFCVAALLFFLFAAGPPLVAGGHADLSKYPFSRVLYDEEGQYYAFHWNFDIEAETIYFAVNVSTEGWVGFGVSPTGQMPGSDVVIGWVAQNGNTYFHVSFGIHSQIIMCCTACNNCFSKSWQVSRTEDHENMQISYHESHQLYPYLSPCKVPLGWWHGPIIITSWLFRPDTFMKNNELLH